MMHQAGGFRGGRGGGAVESRRWRLQVVVVLRRRCEEAVVAEAVAEVEVVEAEEEAGAGAEAARWWLSLIDWAAYT